MEFNEIKETIEKAIIDLFKNQENIFDFTPQTGQTEWNLAHHLAIEIHKFFPRYNCDIDVTKHNYGNKRPDMIFHKRGGNGENFLVVEVKFNGTPNDLQNDGDKIKANWFLRPLLYQFGAVVNLKSDKTGDVYLFQNEQNPQERKKGII